MTDQPAPPTGSRSRAGARPGRRRRHDPAGLGLAHSIARSVGAQRRRRRRGPRRDRVDPQSPGPGPTTATPSCSATPSTTSSSAKGWVTDLNVHTLLARWPAWSARSNAEHSKPESYADSVLTVRDRLAGLGDPAPDRWHRNWSPMLNDAARRRHRHQDQDPRSGRPVLEEGPALGPRRPRSRATPTADSLLSHPSATRRGSLGHSAGDDPLQQSRMRRVIWTDLRILVLDTGRVWWRLCRRSSGLYLPGWLASQLALRSRSSPAMALLAHAGALRVSTSSSLSLRSC